MITSNGISIAAANLSRYVASHVGYAYLPFRLLQSYCCAPHGSIALWIHPNFATSYEVLLLMSHKLPGVPFVCDDMQMIRQEHETAFNDASIDQVLLRQMCMCSNVITPNGRIPERTLRRKLQSQAPDGILLGTELPAAAYATYDLKSGAEALSKLDHDAFVNPRAAPHVKTLGFPPTELTLLQLHRFLAQQFPGVTCARWPHWRMDTPVSPALAQDSSCGMGLRFLQHWLDAHELDVHLAVGRSPHKGTNANGA